MEIIEYSNVEYESLKQCENLQLFYKLKDIYAEEFIDLGLLMPNTTHKNNLL